MGLSVNDERRKESLRNRLTSTVKVLSPQGVAAFTYTVNISNVGLALSDDGWDVPSIGSFVSVQVQGLPIEAPYEEMVIARHESGVVGLTFGDMDQETVQEVMTGADADVLDYLDKLDGFEGLDDLPH